MSLATTIRPRPFKADDVSEQDEVNELAHQVYGAVRGLKFGSVELVFHDGRLVQIERREKTRLGTLGFQTKV